MFAWLVGVLGCVGTSPLSDLGTIDASKVVVYFSVEGIVYGRGDSGAVTSAGVQCVRVTARPSVKAETLARIEPDGSFQFKIGASNADTLELIPMSQCSGDRSSIVLGDPIFVQVPTGYADAPEWYCCGAPNGTCALASTLQDNDDTCPDRTSPNTVPCFDANGCAQLAKETIPLRDGNIRISPPNERGRVDIEGLIPLMDQGRSENWKQVLVTYQNRSQLGISGPGSTTKNGVITDALGRFQITNVSARGDDEFVFQLVNLTNIRSVQMPVIVPDSKLVGLDLLGGFALPTTPGQHATIGLRFNVLGADGRGICADDLGMKEDPLLCLTGGLQHSQVHLDSMTFRFNSMDYPANPTVSTHNPRRGMTGDPWQQAQTIMLVIDMSRYVIPPGMGGRKVCRRGDPTDQNFRFAAASSFLRTSRKRDQIGIVAYGLKDDGGMSLPPEMILPPAPSDNGWAAQEAAINALRERRPGGDPDVLEAMALASTTMRDIKVDVGNIVVFAFCDERTEPVKETIYSDTVAKLELYAYGDKGWATQDDRSLDGYSSFILGVDLPAKATNVCDVNVDCSSTGVLADAADITPRGYLANFRLGADLVGAATELAAFIAGSYDLLYEVDVPPSGTGNKIDTNLRATVTIDGVSVTSDWSGLISL